MAVSPEEFDQWANDHGPALYRVAYRMIGDRHEAEDVVQDAFRSAWKSRRLFDQQRGARAWLVSILRRRVVDRWRKAPIPVVLPIDTPLELSAAGEDPLANDYTDEMQQALGRLPTELRETLLLVVVAELTHQETADLLKIPLGTVLSRVSRARGKLRDYMMNPKEASTRKSL